MPASRWKRPESVLVVVHTDSRVLLLERVHPAGFWQSVTGSLEPAETPLQAASRELAEETGIAGVSVRDLALVQTFPIAPAWRERYHPDVVGNAEHAFAVRLEDVCAPQLNPAEHCRFRWAAVEEALVTVSSYTNKAAIRHAMGLAG